MSSCRVTEVPGRPWDARLRGLYRALVGSQVVRRRSMARSSDFSARSSVGWEISACPRLSDQAR